MSNADDITAVAGVWVGHATDPVGLTGVTAVVCPGGAAVAADCRGGAPGTRETDLARPGQLVEQAHAVLLCGGSAWGLAAADGAMRWLAEHGYGFPTPGGLVPIVPAAVVYDLDVGDRQARPGPEMGYAACAAAGPGPLAQGNAGAGTGCRAGALLGAGRATKSGLGSAARRGVAGRWTVGAVAAANPAGEIRDPATGAILAGARGAPGQWLALEQAWLGSDAEQAPPDAGQNTTIAVVATDAPLTREQAWRVALMAHDGIARAVFPAHSPFDGDTVFALATGAAGPGPVAPADVARLGAAAVLAVADAIARAAQRAEPAGGLPAGAGWIG